MPLLNANQKISASLAERAKNIASHLAATANQANSLVNELLSLNDENLTSWLNSQPQEEIFELFGAHADLGTHVNNSLDTTSLILSASGMDVPSSRVDIRPFTEKLSDGGRTFAIDPENGTITINTDAPTSDS